MLKSNADIAFADGAERMLRDKELKKKQKEVAQIGAEWSKAQHDVIRAKIAISDTESDMLAREQKTRHWLFVWKMGNVLSTMHLYPLKKM